MQGNTGLGLPLQLVAALGISMSLFVSSDAFALGGQCKWEGGPGAIFPPNPNVSDPNSYCLQEDCVGNRGYAQCTSGVIRPHPALTDADVDGQKWQYPLCDDRPPYTVTYALWCAAKGGTWQADSGGYNYYCESPGKDNSEPQAIQYADTFISLSFCQITNVVDSGWGQTGPASNCWRGPPQYKYGELIWDNRFRDYSGKAPDAGGACTLPASLRIAMLRHRDFRCPDGYKSRELPDGKLQCYRPVEATSCVANPVLPGLGAKVHSETDFQSATISFSRHYHSAAVFRTTQAVGSTSIDDYWRHSYFRRLTPVTGNASLVAALQMPDGSVQYFDVQGKDVHNKDGGAEKLVSVAGGWKLTRANYDVENFDANARLTSIVARNGQTQTLAYDGGGRLSAVADAFGRSLSLAYNAQGQMISMTSPKGEVTSYGYDARERIATVTYPGSVAKTYHYESPQNEWFLTGISDE
jgi:YD repeat-containing protein